jgi:hypothetical protein
MGKSADWILFSSMIRNILVQSSSFVKNRAYVVFTSYLRRIYVVIFIITFIFFGDVYVTFKFNMQYEY